MPKLKTLEAASIISVSSPKSLDEIIITTATGRTKFKSIPKHHVNEAMTQYLRSISMINDDEEVTNFNKAPDSLDVKVEKIA